MIRIRFVLSYTEVINNEIDVSKTYEFLSKAIID
jgi:hypothetical protein